MFYRIIRVVYPYFFRLFNFYRFKAKICRFAPGQISLGKGSTISAGTIVNLAVGAKLYLDDGVYIGEYCNIRCDKEIRIGENSKIAQFVTIVDGDYKFGSDLEYSERNVAPITIGKNVFIGSHCCILKGAKISDYEVIGALISWRNK